MPIIRTTNKSGAPLSVAYFGARAGQSDSMAALNLAFEQARVQRRAIYAPGGTYDVSGPLLWGTQTDGGQSDAPNLLFGDGSVTRFRAVGDWTEGTAVFKARNIAGSVLRDFSVDGANKTGVVGVDVDWLVGEGPSLSNTYERLWVENITDAVAWKGKNNNDCTHKKIIVRNTTPIGKPAFLIDGRGGLITLDECQWPDGYASLGAQVMSLSGCWGKGIVFLGGCENVVNITGGYLYSSLTTEAIFSTENVTAGCKVEALNVNGAWLDIGDNGHAVFKGRYATGAQMRAVCLTSPGGQTGKLFEPGLVADLGAGHLPRFLIEHSRKFNLPFDWTVPATATMKRTQFDDGGVMINDA